jgi:hypothetical protein
MMEKLRFKIVNDGLDNMYERIQQWNDGFPVALGNAGACERYEHGEVLYVYFHWRIQRGGVVDGKNCVAVFQSAERCGQVEWDGLATLHRDARFCEPEMLVQVYDQAVFIDVVEFRQVSEQPSRRVVSVVGLQFLDHFNCARRNMGFDFSQPFVEILGLGGIKREGRAPLMFERRVLQKGQLEDQVVKGRPEIMNGITDEQSPLQRWLTDAGDGVIGLPLRIVFDGNRIGGVFRRYSAVDTELQVFKVVFGVRDLGPDTSQSRGQGGHLAMKKKPVMQRTERGTEIPVPRRGDFFKNLKKAATPEKSGHKRGPKQK